MEMRKILLFFVIISCFSSLNVVINNKDTSDYRTVVIRAGGGSSSGGSGGGYSTSHSHSIRGYYNPISRIINLILFFILAGMTTIVFVFKIKKAAFNSKKLLKKLKSNDKAWKYETIEKQVIDTFYIVQEAWSNMKMETAKDYMEKELYESFSTKIEWMKYGNKRNVLKNIKLLSVEPISIHDDDDDSRDFLWLYMRGSMIDYTINTETEEIIDGNDSNKQFVEFWKFVRRDDDKWVLAKILQKEEADKITFQK